MSTLPKPSNTVELYLVQTVDDEPSSIVSNHPDILNSDLEGGMLPTQPEVSDSNRLTSSELFLSGEAPTSAYKAIQNGSTKLRITTTGASAIFSKSQDIKSATNRFKIKKTNAALDSSVYLEWVIPQDLDTSDFSSLLPGETFTVHTDGVVAHAVGSDGAYYVFVIANINTTSDYRILIWRWHQKDSSNALSNFVAWGYSQKLISEIGITKINTPSIAACSVDKNIYILISHYGDDSTAPKEGRMHLFVFPIVETITNPSVTLVTKDMTITRGNENIRIDGGISISYGLGGLFIAAGTRDASRSSDQGDSRDVQVVFSRDFANWTTINSDGATPAAIGNTTSIYDLDGTNTVRSMAKVVDEDTTLLLAVGSNGLILVSKDYGATWSSMASFASRNNIDLTACAILRGEDAEEYIMYAAGWVPKGGAILLRSIDMGESWYLVNAPANMSIQNYIQKEGATQSINAPNGTVDGFYVSTEDFQRNSDNAFPYSLTNALIASMGEIRKILVNHSSGDTYQIFGERIMLYLIGKDKICWVDNAQKSTNINTNPNSPEIVYGFRFQDSNLMTGCFLTQGIEQAELLVAGHIALNTEFPSNSGRDRAQYAAESGWENVPRFCRIKNATFARRGNNQKYNLENGFYFSVHPVGTGLMITDCDRASSTLVYAIDELGNFIEWTPNSSVTHLISATGRPTPPSVRDIAKIITKLPRRIEGTISAHRYASVAIAWSGTQDNAIAQIYAGHGSTLYVSDDLGVTWKETKTELNMISSLVILNEETVIMADDKIVQYNPILRAYPYLSSMSDGSIWLSVSNLTFGRVEVWKIENNRNFSNDIVKDFYRVFPPFIQIGGKEADETTGTFESIAFNADIPTDNSISDAVPRSSLVEAQEGTVFLATYDRILATTLALQSWYLSTSPNIPIPMYRFTSNAPDWTDTQMRRTLTMSQYGNCPIYAFFVSTAGTPGVAVSRILVDVPADGSVFIDMPIIPEKMQSIGIGSLAVIWSGMSVIGDSYDIGTESQYSARQAVLEESPQYFWRNDSDTKFITNSANIEFLWNKRADGEGSVYNVNAISLIGTNFPYARWAVSVPEYRGTTFPLDKSQYIEFEMSAIIHQGIFYTNAAAASSGTWNNVVHDPSLTLIPNQYGDSGNAYYVLIAKSMNGISSPANCEIRKIISNTKNMIYYDGDPVDLTAVAGQTVEYAIFADVMFNNGSNGENRDDYGYPQPELAGTEKEFCQWIRLTIPNIYNTAEGYHKIGKIIIGRHIPFYVVTENGELPRDRFNSGWKFSINAETNIERSQTGLSRVKHIGQIVKSYELQYENIESWQVDVFYNLLFPKIYQAFVLVFDSQTPTSAKLVRLSSQIEGNHVGGEIFSHGVRIAEVK